MWKFGKVTVAEVGRLMKGVYYRSVGTWWSVGKQWCFLQEGFGFSNSRIHCRFSSVPSPSPKISSMDFGFHVKLYRPSSSDYFVGWG
jgi:hypothetical protein